MKKVENFDYGSINDEHKKTIEEVIKLAKEQNNEIFAEFLALKFGIKPLPQFDLNDSEFINICKKTNMVYTLQGDVIDNGIRYPIVSIMHDIRFLDQWIKDIKNL